MTDIDKIISSLAAVAEDPLGYARAWKDRTQGKVIGILPMNFPAELVRAAGALPLLIQEDDAAITYGRSLLFEFYCGYTRSLVDQAATGKFGGLDGLFLVDHCVALLGAVDAIRFELPDLPVYLAQYPASMDEPATPPMVRERLGGLWRKLEQVCETTITPEALRAAIAASNANRAMLRRIHDMRRAGQIALSGRQMQALVKSAMVMDAAEHGKALTALVALLEGQQAEPSNRVRLHLSGHFCHAPKPELLDMIESCGVTIVDDDLFTGTRFVATDIPEDGDPAEALARWYFDRNDNVPCSTRAQKSADWESYLAASIRRNGADGVIVLVAKFCEPHMLYYPELRKMFHANGIPHLLIETEHEGLPLEMVKTRVEALIEGIRQSGRTRETA
ncbi:2-hydroxyacyl-CoA dehydratase [Paracoccus sp. YIM 132242]|uniref:2-hydroxyacyl-CoA dehydratase n=1 Tax=Paracoccus lichenicola TaxID=2665644 RepID=A0A6L6HR46_9RHOB|nr:2-hydroxyacyl-CoA dehydratase [Paracoccus lichenicola]